MRFFDRIFERRPLETVTATGSGKIKAAGGQQLVAVSVSLSVTVSYIQVYNGKIQDLCCGKELPELKLKHGKLASMARIAVRSAAEAMSVVLKGNKVRAVRAHAMNSVSSRSHTVMIAEVTRTVDGGKPATTAMWLVDLAGSESAAVTGVAGEGMQEAREINKSLISLARVLNALNENKKRSKGKQVPVPFRESPLTLLLNDVLAGERFVCSVILNVSVSSALEQARQTAKTMAFGDSVVAMARGVVLGNRRSRKMSRF